jgi:hypothetical protein
VIMKQENNEKMAAMLAIYEAKLMGCSHFVQNEQTFILSFIELGDGIFDLFVNETEVVCTRKNEWGIYNFLVNMQLLRVAK